MSAQSASRIVMLAACIGSCAALSRGAVTFESAVRSASATATATGETQAATSDTLAPFATTVAQTAPVLVGGVTVNTGAVAEISCTFDPEGVKGRTRLRGTGAGGATGIATTFIETTLVVSSEIPWRIRTNTEVFSTAGQSSLRVALTDAASGATIYTTGAGNTGASEIAAFGVLAPGVYRFVYDARLTATNDGCDRDFVLRFDAHCPADLDDGSGDGNADGAVGIDDLILFVQLFQAGDEDADLDNGTGSGLPDAAVGIDDLLYFLARFEQGC